MEKELKVGLIGLSEGNGHPFSFGAILNGYKSERIAEIGWPVIEHYLQCKHPSEFGIPGVRVHQVWTQEEQTAEKLADFIGASPVPHSLDLLKECDAILLARDDYETHWEIAEPFLKAGKRIFIDKPLAPEPEMLSKFLPFLRSGQVMSAAGLRYMVEADSMRVHFNSKEKLGNVRLIRGTIVGGWEKYGIHLIEAVNGIFSLHPIAVTASSARGGSGPLHLLMETAEGPHVSFDVLGQVPKVLRLEVFEADRWWIADAQDNFSMFKRMLCDFFETVRSGHRNFPVDPEQVVSAMKVLIAGNRSSSLGRRVALDEIKL